jgi:hypothetical protein
MRRTLADIQKQFVQRNLPQVNTYWAQITQVLFPAHAFKVNASGYSGPSVVYADASIDFGTLQQPKVFRGNKCKIERDTLTGDWHASAYSVAENCAPTTIPGPPNVPLPVYVPPYTPIPVPPFPPLPPLPPFPPWPPIPTPKPKPPPTPPPTPGKGDLLYATSDKRGVAKCVLAYSGTPVWSSICTTRLISAIPTAEIIQTLDIVNGADTAFLTDLAIGDRIVSTSGAIDGNVTNIATDTECTVDSTGNHGAETFVMYKLKANLLNPNALKIRAFNLDPWSVSGDHFTRAWALTDDGIYRCDGLPNAGVWTRKLSRAEIATLTGKPIGELCFPRSLLLSVRLSGLVAILVKWWNGGPSTPSQIYTIYSLDSGTTWACNKTKYILSGWGFDLNGSFLHASFHLDNMYYMVGQMWGNEGGFFPKGSYAGIAVVKSNDLQSWSAAQQLYSPLNYEWGTELAQPYCDSSGNFYADDKRMYVFGMEYGNGTHALRKYISFCDPPYPAVPPPTVAVIGNAAMDWGHSSFGDLPCPYKLFIHMFNENRMVSIGQHGTAPVPIWTSLNGGGAWTQIAAPVIAGRTSGVPTSLFMIPCEQPTFFAVAPVAAGGGFAMPMMTKNFGANWTDISRVGFADGMDTVLGLTAGNMNASFIIIDYYKV